MWTIRLQFLAAQIFIFSANLMSNELCPLSRVQLKCDGTRWRTGGEVKGKTGEWSGYSILFTLPRNMVYPALLPLTRTPRLPVVDWTDTPDNLNGLVRFAERRNLVSARVPLLFKCSLPMPHFLRVKYPDVKLATHSRLAPGISVEQ